MAKSVQQNRSARERHTFLAMWLWWSQTRPWRRVALSEWKCSVTWGFLMHVVLPLPGHQQLLSCHQFRDELTNNNVH